MRQERLGCQLWSTFSSTAPGEAIFNKKLHVQDRFSIPAGLRITLNVATNRINGNKGNQAGFFTGTGLLLARGELGMLFFVR